MLFTTDMKFHILILKLQHHELTNILINSLMCGEGSVFDQKQLTCIEPSEAIPCQESSNFLYVNEQFGRPEEKGI